MTWGFGVSGGARRDQQGDLDDLRVISGRRVVDQAESRQSIAWLHHSTDDTLSLY
ncbi:hypothetical protein ABT158_30955 [Nonomuraea sp. NPDC001636]|uniref:hypothetical protein n=1 Tax=Nonomuraea sp. NPDC001636 TaxID=3154391 RepID=UPI00332BCD3F